MKNRLSPSPIAKDADPWRQVWQLAGPDLWVCRWILLRGYLFGLIAITALVLLPWPLKLIIDHVMAGHPLPEPFAWSSEWLWHHTHIVLSQEHLIVVFALGYALIALLATVCGAAEKIAGAQVRERMVVNLRDKVLKHFQSLSGTQRSKQRSGDLGLHMLVDVHHLVRLLSKTVPLVVRHCAIAVFTLTVMFWIQPTLAVAGLMIVIILAVLVRIKGSRLRQSSRLKRTKEGLVAGYTQEFVKGMDTVQALSAEGYIRRRFRNINRESLRAGIDETAAAVSMERAMQMVNGLAVALIMGSSGFLVLRQQLTLGEMTVFVAYMIQLLKPVEKINEMASAISRGLARAEHLGRTLVRMPIIKDHPSARPLTCCRGVIQLYEISFHYPGLSPKRLILDKVNLRLEPGQLTVLSGPSVSGKSTLLNLILRQQIPSGGEILIDGRPYSHVTIASVRRQFGVMLQHHHLFAGTLRDALWMSDQHIDEERIWQVLAMVGMAGHVRRLSAGLDTILEEEGTNFSGGQRARLSLARALLPDRPILLLDEPLANIDVASQAVILEALEHIRQRKTIFAISHQPSLMATADEVLILNRGRLSCGHHDNPVRSYKAIL